MAITTKRGTILINEGRSVLMREIKRMLPYTTITLLGNGGTGKTSIVEDVAKEMDFDEFIILRLQGLSSEDFRIPTLVTRKDLKAKKVNVEDKVVEFAKIGVFREICENPDKKYLIFFDEILRADFSVAPLLFELLERKIDGIFRPNMYVMTASNFGGSYIQNIDYEDDAFRRRQIFIEYAPNKQDVLDYMSEHDYHCVIREILEMENFGMDLIIDHETTQELEQTTQLGSWSLLNSRWRKMEEEKKVMNYRSCKEDLLIFGSYFFNNNTKSELVNRLTLLEELNTIDIQKEIIDNNGLNTEGYVMKDKQGQIYNYSDKKNELFIKTKFFVFNKIMEDPKYIDKNILKISKVFINRPEMLLSLFFKLEKECAKNTAEPNLYVSFANKIYKIMLEESKNDPEIAKSFNNLCDGVSIFSGTL